MVQNHQEMTCYDEVVDDSKGRTCCDLEDGHWNKNCEEILSPGQDGRDDALGRVVAICFFACRSMVKGISGDSVVTEIWSMRTSMSGGGSGRGGFFCDHLYHLRGDAGFCDKTGRLRPFFCSCGYDDVCVSVCRSPLILAALGQRL